MPLLSKFIFSILFEAPRSIEFSAGFILRRILLATKYPEKVTRIVGWS